MLVALSGGPDSLALLAGTVVVGRELGLLVAAVVVDHGLQRGSAQVAARAAEQARILGCEDVRVTRVAVDQGPGSGGPEAAARRARHAELLRQAGVRAAGDRPIPAAQADLPAGVGATGAGEPPAAAGTVILLGHTRDDQAETVLLGLARGSGTRSLAGMSGRSGLLRRPLLDLPRSVVHAAAAQAAAEDPRLAPWLDPHNRDRAFARGRVRAEAIPALEAALGPGVVEALARSARLARADADALDAWADQVWADCRLDPEAEMRAAAQGWSPAARPGEPRRVAATRPGVWRLLWPPAPPPVVSLPLAVRTRVVRRFLLAAGCPAGALTAEHVERVTALLDRPPGHGEVALPGRRRARREGQALAVRA
ncbi:MAG TPA: ATP-binding protein [Candidatus Nanopelagicales bacterium]